MRLMGTLYIVATPIGNTEDLTLRAIRILFSVEAIACEDTRKTGLLLTLIRNKFAKGELSMARVNCSRTPELISFYDEVEQERTPELAHRLMEGQTIALVSNGGTPQLCDPGFRLVRECFELGIPVVPVPGPSALTSALSASPVPSNKFLFLGFLPPKQTKRIEILSETKTMCEQTHEIAPAVIVYESVHRIGVTLADIKAVFGEIDILIARELTKTHEEIRVQSITEAIQHAPALKGEFVLIFRL